MSSNGQSCQKSTKRFSEKDLQKVETSENNQVQLYEWVSKSKGFSEDEKKAANVASVTAFDEYWRQTKGSKIDFDRKQEKGCGLWSKRYQNSAELIQPFLNAFSPIIDIVKDFGAPYGGLAVGTISLLFAVAWNKNGMEKSLASTISSVQNQLPSLRLYQHIYNENHELDIALQSQIVSAYQGFIEFCITATKYYKSKGTKRWLRACSPVNDLASAANEVQDHLERIRHLCEDLLNKNVDSVKRLNIQLNQDNADLKAQIAELQGGHDHDRLTEVQRLLNLEDYSEQRHRREWDEHALAVERDDDLNAEIFQQMRGPELDSFRASKDFQSWREPEQSGLLILAGYNNISVNHVNQCWLSPVAAAVVEDLDQQAVRPIYAYSALTKNGRLLYEVVSTILLQLLRQKSATLRDEDRYAELRSELNKLHQIARDQYESVLAIERVALRVLDFFDESETLYIIIDRADHCRDPKIADHRKALLRLLVKVVEATRCKLKILTIVDGGSWPVESYQDDLEAKKMERLIIHTSFQEIRQ